MLLDQSRERLSELANAIGSTRDMCTLVYRSRALADASRDIYMVLWNGFVIDRKIFEASVTDIRDAAQKLERASKRHRFANSDPSSVEEVESLIKLMRDRARELELLLSKPRSLTASNYA